MKPLEFSSPTSLDDALKAIASAQNDGVGLLSGGTDLIIQYRTGRKELGHMIDVKKIPELQVLSFDPKEGLRLGAAVNCEKLTDYGPIVEHYPALGEGAELIGSTQIQSRATVGGNMCNGSPAADTVCPLIVHDAMCVIAGPQGRREVHARDFMSGPGKTALQPGEVLVEFRMPPPEPRASSAYLRFIPRNEMDIAVADVATWLALEEDGETVRAARLALGACGPKPYYVEEAGQALVGSRLEASAVEKAMQAMRATASPIDDMRGTAEYRVHLAGVLAQRTIEMAANRIRK